jgi:hypothetical protein
MGRLRGSRSARGPLLTPARLMRTRVLRHYWATWNLYRLSWPRFRTRRYSIRFCLVPFGGVVIRDATGKVLEVSPG